jgi:hypothetical protein
VGEAHRVQLQTITVDAKFKTWRQRKNKPWRDGNDPNVLLDSAARHLEDTMRWRDRHDPHSAARHLGDTMRNRFELSADAPPFQPLQPFHSLDDPSPTRYQRFLQDSSDAEDYYGKEFAVLYRRFLRDDSEAEVEANDSATASGSGNPIYVEVTYIYILIIEFGFTQYMLSLRPFRHRDFILMANSISS